MMSSFYLTDSKINADGLPNSSPGLDYLSSFTLGELGLITNTPSNPLAREEAQEKKEEPKEQPNKCGAGMKLTVEYKGDAHGTGGPHQFGESPTARATGLPEIKDPEKKGKPEFRISSYNTDVFWNVQAWSNSLRVCRLKLKASVTNAKYKVMWGIIKADEGVNPDVSLGKEFGDKSCTVSVCRDSIELKGQKFTHKIKAKTKLLEVGVTIEITCDVKIDIEGFEKVPGARCPKHGLPYPHEGSLFQECYEEEILRVKSQIPKFAGEKPQPTPQHPQQPKR